MKFVEIDEARSMPGLRLVVPRGHWALWSEFVKSFLWIKKIPYVAVTQHGFQDNPELVAWTGVRNQPQVVYNDESVRTNWLDILNLVERIEPKPALLPQDSYERALVVGLANELCGEWGFGWCRRIQLSAGQSYGANYARIMKQNYGQTDSNAFAAEQRCADIVSAFAARLHRQRDAGSRYLVGNSLTAVDVYWACSSNLIGPLPLAQCPMGEQLHHAFANPGPVIGAVMDSILFEHRDYIYHHYLQLPVDFG